MLELLEQERQRCVRSGRCFCLALIDVDHFKQVNDRYGHATGGERLRQRIEAAPLLETDPALRITVSAGLTEHIAGEAVSDALARADRALYQAKAEGRNRIVVAGSTRQAP